MNGRSRERDVMRERHRELLRDWVGYRSFHLLFFKPYTHSSVCIYIGQ